MSKRIKIIGIDPGTIKCGWGIVSCCQSDISHVASGVIKQKATAPIHVRLGQIGQALADVLGSYALDAAACEDSFVGKGAKSSLAIGSARGVAMERIALAGIPFRLISPKEAKAAVATGRAEKDQVRMMVKLRLGLAAIQEDEADALAVAIAAASHLNWSELADE